MHPTAIPGADKLRLMSESARGEGGRVWVPKTPGDARDPRDIPAEDRWYFLEEKYPAYGNLVPRDIASREIFSVCVDEGMGVRGENQVYLDLTHKPRDYLETKLGAILEIYRKFVGEDPCELPMRIFPGVHYSMGGLWTEYTASSDGQLMEYGAPNSMMTGIPGLFALVSTTSTTGRLDLRQRPFVHLYGLFCGHGVANHGVNTPEPMPTKTSSPLRWRPRRHCGHA